MPKFGVFCNKYLTILLLDKVEENIVICQWLADQLCAGAEG